MKIIPLLLTLVLCNGLRVFGHDQHLTIPETPLDELVALSIKERNSTKTFPTLDYWGADGFEWDTAVDLTNPSSSGIQKAFKLKSTRRLISEPQKTALKVIQYSFAAGITNREERLRHYQQVKEQLVNIYQAPTDNIRPDNEVRGRDAYTQDLDKEYHVEWHGPETVVSLRLSDDALVLEFRQAPNSKASEMRDRCKRGTEKRTSATRTRVTLK